MYFVYILKSLKTNKYYVGQTKDHVKRLEQHNKGYSKSTKSGIPWQLVYYKEFQERNHAYRFEQQIKMMKSKSFIEEQIAQFRASRWNREGQRFDPA